MIFIVPSQHAIETLSPSQKNFCNNDETGMHCCVDGDDDDDCDLTIFFNTTDNTSIKQKVKKLTFISNFLKYFFHSNFLFFVNFIKELRFLIFQTFILEKF